MQRTYTVTGMTCKGCKAKVETTILKLDGVYKVSVDLNTQTANVYSEKALSPDFIQSALPEKYKFSGVAMPNEEQLSKSEFQQLKPLFLIFTYILFSAIGLHYKHWDWSGFMLDFMGLFYIVFSFFKLLDLKGFPESFKMYDPLAKAIPAYAVIYPFLEIILGLMFLLRIQIPVALASTIIVLGITTVGVTQSLLSKKQIKCACLGTALKLPMTKATFIENAIMIIMAMVMLMS